MIADIIIFFGADNSRYPLILINRRLHCVSPPLSGVTASIAAADSAKNKTDFPEFKLILQNGKN